MSQPYWKEFINEEAKTGTPEQVPYWKQFIEDEIEVVEPEPPVKEKKQYDNYNTYLSEYDKLHDKTKESLKSFTYGDDFNSEGGTPQSINNPREYAMFMMNNEDNINELSSPFIAEQGQIARDRIIKQDIANRRQESVNEMVVDMMSGGELSTDDLELVQRATVGDTDAIGKLQEKKSPKTIAEMMGSSYSNPQEQKNIKSILNELNIAEEEQKEWYKQLFTDPVEYFSETGNSVSKLLKGIVKSSATSINALPSIGKGLSDQSPISMAIDMGPEYWKKQQLKNANKLERSGDIDGANALRAKAEEDFKDETSSIIKAEEEAYKAIEDGFYNASKFINEWADTYFTGADDTGSLAKPPENWLDYLDPRRAHSAIMENAGTMLVLAAEAIYAPPIAYTHMYSLGAGSVKESVLKFEKENNVRLSEFQREQAVHIVGAATMFLEKIGLDAVFGKLPVQMKGKIMQSLSAAIVEGETEYVQEFMQVWAAVEGEIPLYGMSIEGVGYRPLTKEDLDSLPAARYAGLLLGGLGGAVSSGTTINSETEYSSSNRKLANDVVIEEGYFRPGLRDMISEEVSTNFDAKTFIVRSTNRDGDIVDESKVFLNKEEAQEYYKKQKAEIVTRLAKNGGERDVDGTIIPDGEVITDSDSDFEIVYESDGEVYVSDTHDEQLLSMSKEYLPDSDQVSIPKRGGKRNSNQVLNHVTSQMIAVDKVISGIQDKMAQSESSQDMKAYYSHLESLSKAVDLKNKLKSRLLYAEKRIPSPDIRHISKENREYLFDSGDFPDMFARTPEGEIVPAERDQQVEMAIGMPEVEKDTSLEGKLEPQISDGVVENEDGTYNVYSEGELIANSVEEFEASEISNAADTAKNLTDEDGIVLLNAGFGLTKQSIDDIFGKIVEPGKFKFSNLPKALQDEAEKKGITSENFVELFGQITGEHASGGFRVEGLDKKQNAFYKKVLNKAIKPWFSKKSPAYQVKIANPEAASLLKYLTKEEVSSLTPAKANNLLSIFKKLEEDGVVDNMPYMAMAGIVKKGWYKGSAKAIVDVFGVEDGYRFAALLSAMSPQTSVESNLKNALNVWVNWDKAGRPSGKDAIPKILEIMGESVEGDKGIKSVLDAWRNNSFRAFNAKDPSKIEISGPKVQSFFQNLIGNNIEVTNDTWMANVSYSGEGSITQEAFGGVTSDLDKDEIGAIGRKGGGYLAMNAAVRKAAKKLNNMKIFKDQGVTWTPAEVQETVWSWAKAALEARTKDTETIPKMVEKGMITDEVIAGTPDFAQLLQIPMFRDILKGTKYEKRINELEKTERVVIETSLPKKSKHLRESATRLEKLYQKRESEKEQGTGEGVVNLQGGLGITGDAIKQIFKKTKYDPGKTSTKQIPAGFKKFTELTGISKGFNLDYGGGAYDLGTQELKKQGLDSVIYDVFARPEAYNKKTMAEVDKRGGADTVTLMNVLNVIKEAKSRDFVLKDAYSKLKPGGTMMVSVYYDSQGKPGFRGSKDPSKRTWQEMRAPITYLPEIESSLPDAQVQLNKKGNPVFNSKLFILKKPSNPKDLGMSKDNEGLVYLQGGIGLTQGSIKEMFNSVIKPKKFSYGMLPDRLKKQGKILGVTSDNFVKNFSKAGQNLNSLAKNTKAWYKKVFSHMKRWYKQYTGKPIYNEASLSQEMDDKYSPVTEESHNQVIEDSNTGKKPKKPFGVRGLVSEVGQVLSVRAKKVGVEVKKVLRDYQRYLDENIKKDMEKAEPLLAVLNKLQEDAPDTMRKFNIALLARDAKMIDEIINQYPEVEVKINNKLKKVNFKESFDANKELLMDMWVKGDEAFDGMGFIEEETGKIGYYPREVSDLDGLRQKLQGLLVDKLGKKKAQGIIDDALDKYAKKEGKKVEELTTSETSKVINQVVMGNLKAKKGVTHRKSRAIDSGDIELWSQIAPFYVDAPTALINYIHNLNQGVAKQKLFGKGVNPDTLEFEEDYEGTIGGLYADKLLAKENYTPEQQREIVEIFSTLMETKKTPKMINTIKAWGYLGTMADVINTLTQLGDTAIALGRSLTTNPLDVGTSFVKAALDKSEIKARDVFIEDISAEMRTAEGMMKRLDSIFRITGLKKLDKIGKETLINSQIMKFRKDAKIYNKQKDLDKNFWSAKALEFELKLSESFDKSEYDAVIKDLLDGEFTPNTIILAYNTLLDHQPTAPTELPAGYLKNPNLRMFYQLKTWSIKTINTFVEDIQGNNVAANRLEEEGKTAAAKKLRRSGYKKAVQLGLVLTMAGATVDEIKDLLLGKPSNFSDNVYESLLRLMFLSKYSSEKMFKGDLGAVWDSVSEVPVIGMSENIIKDIGLTSRWFSGNLTKKESMEYGLRLPQYVPVVGKFIYYGGGRGRKMELQKAVTRYKQQERLSAAEKRMLRFYERELNRIKRFEKKGKSSKGRKGRSRRSRRRTNR